MLSNILCALHSIETTLIPQETGMSTINGMTEKHCTTIYKYGSLHLIYLYLEILLRHIVITNVSIYYFIL